MSKLADQWQEYSVPQFDFLLDQLRLDRRCPTPHARFVAMKLKPSAQLNLHKTNEIIGCFGSTQLVRRYDGYHEFIGGKVKGRATARGWCSHFAPEIAFADPVAKPRLHPAGL
jgi:hypothetical protein